MAKRILNRKIFAPPNEWRLSASGEVVQQYRRVLGRLIRMSADEDSNSPTVRIREPKMADKPATQIRAKKESYGPSLPEKYKPIANSPGDLAKEADSLRSSPPSGKASDLDDLASLDARHAHVLSKQEEPTPDQVYHPENKWHDNTNGINLVNRVKFPDGRSFYHKQPVDKIEPHIENTVTKVLRHHLLFDDVPQVHVVPASHGRPQSSLAAPVPGVSLSRAAEGPNSRLDAIKKANPPGSLSDWMTASWLLNMEDRHELNYLVDKENSIRPIDFGAAFHESKGGAAFGANHDMLLGYGLVSPKTPLNKEFLQHIASKKDAILKTIGAGLPEHHSDPEWKSKAVENVKKKFDHIPGLLDHPGPTLADLPKDDSGRLGYHEAGEWARNRGAAWAHSGEATS